MKKPVDIQTTNPLAAPYPTGRYLISDEGEASNFRSAMDLPERPYRASGSHQLGIAGFVQEFANVIAAYRPPALYLVDLREETHGFFDGAPVSWYSDNDFGNVGLSMDWIIQEERALFRLCECRSKQVYVIEPDASDDLRQERVVPVSYAETFVHSARTEEAIADVLSEVFRPISVHYVRIPVTDHCAPNKVALDRLSNLAGTVGPNDWVHFHCHGGDGRTTTFLALLDMILWKRSSDPLPPLKEFANRQCQLFAYCLDPEGCECGEATTGWKLSLSEVRWQVLGSFLSSYRDQSSASGSPSPIQKAAVRPPSAPFRTFV